MRELPRPRKRAVLAVAGTVAAVAAVLLTVPLLAGGGGSLPSFLGASPEAEGYTCIATGPDAAGTCERQAEDFTRRRPITAAQRAQAEATGRAVEKALLAVPYPDEPGNCDATACTMTSRPANETDVAAVRAALTKAGFPTATVRLARPTDPAAPGSILYAVPAGPACILGYQTPDGAGSHTVVGPLPPNACLSP